MITSSFRSVLRSKVLRASGSGDGRRTGETDSAMDRQTEQTDRRRDGCSGRVRSFEEIPHTGSNGWMNLLHFWRSGTFNHLHKHMEQNFNTLGPIYRQYLGSQCSVNIVLPVDIAELFRSEGPNPRRMTLQPWDTHRETRKHSKGVFLKNGAEWRSDRLLLNREVMMSSAVREFLPLLDEVAQDFTRLLQRKVLTEGQQGNHTHTLTFDPSPELFRFALEASCHVLYGERIGLFSSEPSQESERFIWAVEQMLNTTPPLLYVPRPLLRFHTPLWTQHATAWDHIFSHAEERIQRVYERLHARGDSVQGAADSTQFPGVLQLLMERGQLPLELIRANITELMAGGVDTTAVPLQFALFELARNPAVQERVRAQVQSSWLQAERNPHKALQGAPLLKGTVKETLRLYPVGITVQRYPVRDIVLQNYHIPAETLVQVCLYPLGRSQDVFQDPLTFDPSRWTGAEPGEGRGRKDVTVETGMGFRSLAFGFGARQCVGRRIAENEMQLLLLHLEVMVSRGVSPCVDDSFLEHLCLLDVDHEPIAARNTGIICTIGPASRSVFTLQAMVKAGMNIARLNFSHGTHQYHRESIRNIREAVESLTFDPLAYRPVAIALDTKGPEIRTGLVRGLVDGEVMLERGSVVTLVTAAEQRDVTDASRVWVDYPDLSRVVKSRGTIYIDDGLIALTVLRIGDGWVETRVESGGILCSRKGVNLPGAELLNLPAVGEQDRADLQLGVAEGVDIVFASFIRCAEDVRDIRRTLGPRGAQIQIISKVENRQGVENFGEILRESDGVMVARGDLGMEIPAQKVFVAQKMMIGRCNAAGKPVICATQMLESMVCNARPTRAESSDVANAVLDGADCVMLSAETAKGRYPVEAVTMMHSICREAEAALFYQRVFEDLRRLTPLSTDPTEVAAIGAVESSFKCSAGAIIVLTTSGRSAHLLSRYRPSCPIIAVTRNVQMARQSQLLRGVFPAIFRTPPAEVWADDVDNRVTFGMDIGKARGFFKPGDMVILVTGWSPGSGHTNIMRVVTVP